MFVLLFASLTLISSEPFCALGLTGNKDLGFFIPSFCLFSGSIEGGGDGESGGGEKHEKENGEGGGKGREGEEDGER